MDLISFCEAVHYCKMIFFLEQILTFLSICFAQGNRYITISGSLWLQDIAKILDEEFRPLGKSLTNENLKTKQSVCIHLVQKVLISTSSYKL